MPNTAPSAPVLLTFPTSAELVGALAQFIIKAQKESVEKKGRFAVALSGGSLPKQLSGLVNNPAVKWDKWYVHLHPILFIRIYPPVQRTKAEAEVTLPIDHRHVFYADERVVPLDHEDSNHALCVRELFSKLTPGIPPHQIHTINPDLADDLEELADAYEKELIHEFAMKDAARFPIFDLILLGVGPDGHTCSLFPGHELLSEEDRWVAYIEDSPKHPQKRITLTYPVLNHAARIAFVATGAGKQDTLHTVLDEPEQGLPASRVRPVHPGHLYWFLDDAAAGKVQYPRTPFKL